MVTAQCSVWLIVSFFISSMFCNYGLHYTPKVLLIAFLPVSQRLHGG